ncbi:MAG: putative integral rane acyltransferase [Pedosphaera sp.]|nr:putative integral rane acyltransferase [Pedosphaera sp.]
MRRWLQQHLKQWFITPSSGVHFDVADGLRGMAILMVVACHGLYINTAGSKLSIQLHSVIAQGWLGVHIFFVLSAFLLSLPFFRGRERDPDFWYHPGYTIRRALKILPPLYLSIIVLVLFRFWYDHGTQALELGIVWATGIAHFVYYPQIFNSVLWSLWVEIGFYVALPLLFLALRRRNVRVTGWVLFAILLLVPTITRRLTWPNPIKPEEWFFIASRFPSSLDTFAWGVLFSSFYVSMSREPERWRHLARLGYAGLGLVCLAGVAAHFTMSNDRLPRPGDLDLIHLLSGSGGCLLLFFIFDPACLGSRIFASPALRFLGIVSFEWFLIHQLAQGYFRTWMVSSHGSFFRYCFTVATPTLLSLAVATGVYYKFSLPIMRWGRNRFKQPETPARQSVPPKEVVR